LLIAQDMRVRDIMTRNVRTLEPECPVAEAAKISGARNRSATSRWSRGEPSGGLLTPFDLLGLRARR